MGSDPTTTPATPPRSPWGAGALAGLYAVGVGYVAVAVIVLLTWAFAPDNAGGDPASMGRTAGLAWAMSNFGSVDVGGQGILRFAPLGFTLALAFAISRAGSWAARAADIRNLREATAIACTLALTYAAAGLFLASLVSTDQARALPASLAAGAFGLAAVAGGVGVLRGGNLRRAAVAALPESARAVLFAASSAVAVMVLGGGFLVTASLIVHYDRVVDLTRGLAADPVGGGALALLGVAFVPNLAAWAATFTLGTGFSVDAGSVVAPSGIDLGALPAFPVLGALPDSGVLSGWTYLVLLVPVAAGAVLGHAVNRGLRGVEPLKRVVVAAVAATVSAVALGGLAYLSGGALGDAALRQIGPDPFATAAMAGLVQLLTAVVVVWEWPRLRARIQQVRPAVPGIKPIVVDLRERLGVGPDD
ncbi:MAG: DUF6350 family protein [Candidatus Nanopelagicales bacterium]